MYEVGGIINGSSFDSNTSIQSIIIKMLGDSTDLDYDTTPPNARYKSQNLGTWSSIKDVDNFLNKCNHATGYYGATIGSYVTINDGVYNKQWVIAGFDMEYNRRAADETIYNNGYGICLIPKTSLGNATWNDNYDTPEAYNNSTMNKTTLPTVANNLKKILGSHLIQRNVLLSNSRDSSSSKTGYANNYTWTTAYCTLMSMGQVTGTFASNRNKYDDGEANYKLSLFNYESWSFDTWAWLRGIYSRFSAYILKSSGDSDFYNYDTSGGLRPLIYIR